MSGATARGGEGANHPAVVVDVWNDFVCPYCYLEMPVLDRVRAHFGAGTVAVAWRAFELRPDPVPTLDPAGDYLRNTWARSVYPLAAERGMTLRLPPVQPRSRLALEATAFASDAGRADPMVQAVFSAFFEGGQDIGRLDVLVGLGATLGLDAAALRDALDRGTYTRRVLDDEHEAARLGIRGVPAMVVRRAGEPAQAGRLVTGAQPFEAVADVVSAVLAGTRRRAEPDGGNG